MITDCHKSVTAMPDRRATAVYASIADHNFSGSRYSIEDRVTAATHFLVTGNMAQVSKATGIPETTLSGWRKSEWWVPLVADLRSEYDEELDGKLTGLLHRAVDALICGLDRGDTVLVRGSTGSYESRQKSVSARDLAVISGIIYDKRALLRRMPTSIRDDGCQDKLKAMAEKFGQIADTYREKQSVFVSNQET